MKKHYKLTHRLIACILFVGLFLQSCGGFSNQIISKEKGQPSRTLELSDNPLINTDKKIVTSGGYLASFYEEDEGLKANLRVDEKQPEPNYKDVPVMIEEGTDLFSLTKLDHRTQQNRIELNRSDDGQLRHIVIRKGGLLGGMMEGDEEVGEKLEDEAIPNECFCPITQEIMEDPVMAQDGHTYERSAIQRWFDMGKRISPKTGARLLSTELILNHTMRSLIQDLKAQMPVLARHKLNMDNIEAAIKLREEYIQQELELKGNLLQQEKQKSTFLEKQLAELKQPNEYKLNKREKRKEEKKASQYIPKLSDIKELRRHFYKGCLEITSGNYKQLAEVSQRYESSFMSYEGGVIVKSWEKSNEFSALTDLLLSFSKLKKFKINCSRKDKEELTEVIGRAVQFYEELLELDLSGCQLRDSNMEDIVESIVHPEKLKVVNVRESDLSDKMLSMLERRFSNAEVNYDSMKVGDVFVQSMGQLGITVPGVKRGEEKGGKEKEKEVEMEKIIKEQQETLVRLERIEEELGKLKERMEQQEEQKNIEDIIRKWPEGRRILNNLESGPVVWGGLRLGSSRVLYVLQLVHCKLNKAKLDVLLKYTPFKVGLSSAQIIDLAENDLGDDGSLEVAKTLQGTSIEEVCLIANGISSRGAINFASNLQGTSVSKVDLRRNNIPTETEKFLRKQYPQINWEFF